MDVILPIDSYFSSWLSHHQPYIYNMLYYVLIPWYNHHLTTIGIITTIVVTGSSKKMVTGMSYNWIWLSYDVFQTFFWLVKNG